MRWIWWIVSSIVVVAVAGAPFWWLTGPPATPPGDGEPESGQTRVGEAQYYVLLTMIEVDARKDEDTPWDMGGGAPDLKYEILWQGQRVFKSSTKSNTLLAKWSNASVDVKDVLDGVSIDDSIKAARITARPGDKLEFVVYDSDIASDDLIARWTVDAADLFEGDQVWEKPGGRVVSATCRVLRIDGVKFEELTK